jgi:hypothetical protein
MEDSYGYQNMVTDVVAELGFDVAKFQEWLNDSRNTETRMALASNAYACNLRAKNLDAKSKSSCCDLAQLEAELEAAHDKLADAIEAATHKYIADRIRATFHA